MSRLESAAKKEIRNHGGIGSAEIICVTGSSPMRTFALRIFISSLFAKRRDVSFVSSPDQASLVLTDDSLDTVSAGLLDAVLDGSVAKYVASPTPVRTIAPFASVEDTDLYAYAVQNGWHREKEPVTSEIAGFLDDFVKTRPGSKFALKNIADKLSMVSRKE